MRSYAEYNYRNTCGQAWNIKHDIEVTKKTLHGFCNWRRDGSSDWWGRFGCHRSRRVFASVTEAVAAQEALLQAIRTECCVYKKDFRNLHETHKPQGSKDLAESVDLLLCDPLYNIRHQQELQNNKHCVFVAKKMEDFESLQKMYQGVETINISFVPPHSLPSSGGVFAPVRKKRRGLLVIWRCLRWRSRHGYMVVSTETICRTHDCSGCGS